MNSKIFYNWLNVSSKCFNKGINFGHKSIKLAKTQFWHPLMSNYLLGIRHNVSLLNTQQTLKCLLRAFHVIAIILKQKGRLAAQLDADLVLLRRDDLAIDTVIAKGKLLVHQGKALVKGTFEQ